MRDLSAYTSQLLSLLPRGRAWSRDPNSYLGRLLGSVAAEFARFDVRAMLLLEEADPRTALELLPDWERVAGLPDTCSGAPDTIAERQVAVANKIAQRGGQTIAFFTELAGRLGYYVEIEEHRPLEIGATCDDFCNDDSWAFAWTVHVRIGEAEFAASSSVFTTSSACDEFLVGYGALNLECLIGRAKPAHTEVMFSYTIDPEPAFWFDFTSEG